MQFCACFTLIFFFFLLLALVSGVSFHGLGDSHYLVGIFISNLMYEAFGFSFDIVPHIYDILCYAIFLLLVSILFEQKLGY